MTGAPAHLRESMITALLALLAATPALAWDQHREMMPWILNALPETLQKPLAERKLSLPCPGQARSSYDKLAVELQLNVSAQLPVVADASTCVNASATPLQILLGSATDEPDMAMDQDLPDAADPIGSRKWMGGSTGPSSDGFRHMYFGGWRIDMLLDTFQIPVAPVGEAPERADLLARKARELLKSGDAFLGTRLLGWAIHYVQDLAQPYHAVQIPAKGMIPGYTLLAWPPEAAFRDLVQESTRIIGNYHAAYEAYTLTRLRQGEESPYHECLSKPEMRATLRFESLAQQEPLEMARSVAKASVRLAPRVGQASLRFFGPKLKGRDYDLGRAKGEINYLELSIRPDLPMPRQEIETATCAALANASIATRALVAWALQP